MNDNNISNEEKENEGILTSFFLKWVYPFVKTNSNIDHVNSNLGSIKYYVEQTNHALQKIYYK